MNSNKRDNNGLFGWIEQGRRKCRYRYWVYDVLHASWKKKSISCQTLKVARRVQRQMTDKYERGELAGEYELVPKEKAEDIKRNHISVAAFTVEYKLSLQNKHMKDWHESLDDVLRSNPYKTDLQAITKFWDFVSIKHVRDLDMKAIEQYRSKRLAEVSNSSYNRNVNSIRPMLKYAESQGYLKDGFHKCLKKQSVSRNRDVLVFPSVDSINEMFLKCEELCPDLLPLLWAFMKTGVRRHEGIAFKKSWVDTTKNAVTVYQRKTNHKVEIPTDEDVHGMFLALLKDPANKTEFLFVDGKGLPWTETKIQKRLNKIREAVSFDKSLVSCNVFRHTYGSCITLARGIRVAQVHLGHSSIELTASHYSSVKIDYVRPGDIELPYSIRSILWGTAWGKALHNNQFTSMPIKNTKEHRA